MSQFIDFLFLPKIVFVQFTRRCKMQISIIRIALHLRSKTKTDFKYDSVPFDPNYDVQK